MLGRTDASGNSIRPHCGPDGGEQSAVIKMTPVRLVRKRERQGSVGNRSTQPAMKTCFRKKLLIHWNPWFERRSAQRGRGNLFPWESTLEAKDPRKFANLRLASKLTPAPVQRCIPAQLTGSRRAVGTMRRHRSLVCYQESRTKCSARHQISDAQPY